jgi:site-specific DNA recombinase
VRGMQAAMLAGRSAGGRAYGYKRVVRIDVRSELIPGLLEIDEKDAATVQLIFTWFAAGLSSIQVATVSMLRVCPARVAVSGIVLPSAVTRKSWSASSTTHSMWVASSGGDANRARTRTQGSASGATGSATNRNGSRLPFRICASLTTRCSRQPKLRSSAVSGLRLPRRRRNKHLLSRLIRYSCCCSNYTISGKNYYRCAGQKERGTCGNTVSVRRSRSRPRRSLSYKASF